jgi:hypothetical protein
VVGCVTDLNGDQVLIAEGTSYAKNFSANFDNLNLRGFSALYPVVFQSYDPAAPLDETKYGRATANRPLVGTDGSAMNVNGGGCCPGQPMGNVVFRGLVFQGLISILPTGLRHDNVLFENNIISAPGGFAFQNRNSTNGRANHLILRNNAIYGQYGGARTGAYIDFTNFVTLEDNVFWHNGWLPGASRDDPVGSGGLVGDEVFRHLFYVQEDGYILNVRRNFLVDGPADGGQTRALGVLVYGNFYNDNPITSPVGGGTVYAETNPSGADLDYAMNVALGDADITSAFPRGQAIWAENGRNGSRSRYNLFARSRNPNSANMRVLVTDAIFNVPSYMAYDHNVIYLWGNSSNTRADTGGSFPAQNHATYSNNIWDDITTGSNTNIGSVSFPNTYTAAALYSALGYADKTAFINYAIAHPEARIQRSAVALMRTGYGITGPPLETLTSTIQLVKGQPTASVFVGSADGSTLTPISGAPAGFTVSSANKSWYYDGTDNGTSSGNVVIRETLGASTKDSTIAWSSAVAPVLSSISVSPVGSTTATVNVTTDTGGAGNTIYWVAAARNSNYEMLPGAIKAGGDSDYDQATLFGGKSGSQAVAASGAQSISLTGLTPSTNYWLYLMQEKSASPLIQSTQYGSFAAYPFTTSAGGFTPASLSGLAGWWEADPTKLYTDAGVTLVSADGQTVQQMNDKTAGAHDLSRTGSARPIYHTGSGHPYLDFDGVDDTLFTSVEYAAADGTGQHWFAVVGYFNTNTGTQSAASLLGGSAQSFAEASRMTNNAGTARGEAFDTLGSGTFDPGASITAATPVVLIVQVTSTSLEVWVDNVSGGSTALTGTRQTPRGFGLGSILATSNFMGGRIYGAIEGTGTDMTNSTNRANVQTYLRALAP